MLVFNIIIMGSLIAGVCVLCRVCYNIVGILQHIESEIQHLILVGDQAIQGLCKLTDDRDIQISCNIVGDKKIV